MDIRCMGTKSTEKKTSGEDLSSLSLQDKTDKQLVELASTFIDVRDYMNKKKLSPEDRWELISASLLKQRSQKQEKSVMELKNEIYMAMGSSKRADKWKPAFSKQEIEEIHEFVTSKFFMGKLKE